VRRATKRVSTQIRPITTEELGVRMLLGVAALFRMEFLSKLQKLLALPQLRKVKKAAAAPNAWGSLGVFVCTGRKSGES